MLTVKFVSQKCTVVREAERVEIFNPTASIPFHHVVVDNEAALYYLRGLDDEVLPPDAPDPCAFFHSMFVVNDKGKTVDSLRF